MRILTIVAILLAFAVTVSAQSNYPKGIGLQASLGAGINGADIPLGRKNGVTINNVPNFGITSYYPISEDAPLGLTCDLEYMTYAYQIKDVATDEIYKHKYNYLYFNPSLYFHGFQFGFGFGIPLAASWNDVDISTDKLTMMSDFRMGYSYPLFADSTGRINMYISGSYMLSTIYDDFPKNDPLDGKITPEPTNPITDFYNPRAVTLIIGFNYIFNF